MPKIKYKTKIRNIDVFVGTCTECDNDIIYGDAIDDYEFKFCPYCGVEFVDDSEKNERS